MISGGSTTITAEPSIIRQPKASVARSTGPEDYQDDSLFFESKIKLLEERVISELERLGYTDFSCLDEIHNSTEAYMEDMDQEFERQIASLYDQILRNETCTELNDIIDHAKFTIREKVTAITETKVKRDFEILIFGNFPKFFLTF